MNRTIYQPNYWYYLTGDLLYRIRPKLRKAVQILISVVIGALLLAGLYALFNDTILPTLSSRIKLLFDYKG